MNQVELGRSGLKASQVALGVMRISDKTQEEADTIVRTALESGIDFFDTADCYSSGRSSMRLGQSIHNLGIKRDSIYLQTKFGIYRDPDTDKITRYDFSKDHLVKALNAELVNLQTDYVDFVLLHRPDTLVDLEQLAEAFDLLQMQGKVRHVGVSNVNPQQIEMLQESLSQRLEVNQLQFGLGHTNMVQQEFHVNMEDSASVDHDGGLIAYSRRKHMTIQAWSPFQWKFFQGVFIDNPEFSELNQALQKLAETYGVSKSGIAVAWIRRHPAQIQILLGSMTPSRIRDMAAGADVKLTAQEWYDLYLAAGNDLP